MSNRPADTDWPACINWSSYKVSLSGLLAIFHLVSHFLRQDYFRCGWAITQRTVWALSVVVISPMLDDHLGFFQSVEDFTVEQLIA